MSWLQLIYCLLLLLLAFVKKEIDNVARECGGRQEFRKTGANEMGRGQPGLNPVGYSALGQGKEEAKVERSVKA